MPSTGTPSSNTIAARAATAPSCTLAGPPERMKRAGAEGGDARGIGVERPDLAIDAGFAQAAGDQLGHLAAEIEDQHAFGGKCSGGGGIRQGIGHVRSGCCVILALGPCRSARGKPCLRLVEASLNAVKSLHRMAHGKSHSATEANRSFSRILREVAQGDSYTVTSHGRPIARIVPASGKGSEDANRRLLDHLNSQAAIEIGPRTREELHDC